MHLPPNGLRRRLSQMSAQSAAFGLLHPAPIGPRNSSNPSSLSSVPYPCYSHAIAVDAISRLPPSQAPGSGFFLLFQNYCRTHEAMPPAPRRFASPLVLSSSSASSTWTSNSSPPTSPCTPLDLGMKLAASLPSLPDTEKLTFTAKSTQQVKLGPCILPPPGFRIRRPLNG